MRNILTLLGVFILLAGTAFIMLRLFNAGQTYATDGNTAGIIRYIFLLYIGRSIFINASKSIRS